jgi:hypothetical protein
MGFGRRGRVGRRSGQGSNGGRIFACSAFHVLSRGERGRRHLPHLPVRAQPWRQCSLVHIRSEVAPRVTPGLRHDPLASQRQHPQRHLGMKARPRPVRDRAQTQPTCACAPRLLDALPWLVAHGPIGRGQAVVGAMAHDLAVALGFRPACGRIPAPEPACGHAHLPTVTTARPQLTPPLAVAFSPDRWASGPLGRQCMQDLLAMGPLALCLVGMGPDDIAPTTFALPPPRPCPAGYPTPGESARGAGGPRWSPRHLGASADPGGLAPRARCAWGGGPGTPAPRRPPTPHDAGATPAGRLGLGPRG